MNPGIAVGITGAAIGALGGAVGTYIGIQTTHGPRERAFVIRAAIVLWLAVILFTAGMAGLPNPYRVVLLACYGPALAFGLRWVNRRQTECRQADSVEIG